MMLKTMINGGCVSSGYRVLDEQRNPVMRISASTFQNFKELFRKQGIVYLINKNKVRQKHGNSFIKQLYKKSKDGTASNNPDQRVQV